MKSWQSIYIVITSALFIISCSGKFDGKNGTKTYYFQGSSKVQCTEEYKNGKKNGLYEEFYENGKLRFKTWYENDTIRDTTYAYYENGVLSSIQIFSKGYKNGCWKKFSKEGNLYQEICFENGLVHGPSTTYTYRSGKVTERSNYYHGTKDGRQELYYENGKPKSISYYSRGEPCIGLREWDESGKERNNDFKITIDEPKRVLGKMIYTVHLENLKHDDRVGEINDVETDTTTGINPYFFYWNAGDSFKTEFYIPGKSFGMKKIKIAALRKTSFGNTMVKTATYNSPATN